MVCIKKKELLTDSPLKIFIQNNNKKKVINKEQLEIDSYYIRFLRFLRDL